MELYSENELTQKLANTDCVFTHGGKFHADDVFSYALLRMIHPGLLWQQLGAAVLGDQKQAEKFDFRFIQPLDLNDNTGEPDAIASLIADFNPVWDAKEDTDAAFLRAADFAEQILACRLSREQQKKSRVFLMRVRRAFHKKKRKGENR